MSEQLRRALLADDVDTFSRLHRTGITFNSLNCGRADLFCLKRKLFKVYLYLTQSLYGRDVKVTLKNLSWIDVDDDITEFLLKHPQVWYSTTDYSSFKDIYVNRPSKVKNDELQKLREEVADLREKVLALWYSPGMPGYVLAQDRFEQNAQNQDG